MKHLNTGKLFLTTTDCVLIYTFLSDQIPWIEINIQYTIRSLLHCEVTMATFWVLRDQAFIMQLSL